MSALARLFLHEGKQVSGSDRTPSELTSELEKEGVLFFPEQNAKNITDDIDMVVYTEAMSPDHEEMQAAQKLGVPMMNYFEALGAVANRYYLIAVSGTHGKTTTTAMLIDIFEAAGLDPTAVVGSLRAKTKSNFRTGKSKYFIVEACEYKRDFLTLEPDVLIITNLEHEHVDYYQDLADVQDAFRELAEKVPEEGAVIVSCSDTNVLPVVNELSTTVIDYGRYFDPLLSLRQPGLHNEQNASAALAAAVFVGVEKETAKEALRNFTGTWRRFEYKGVIKPNAHGARLSGAPLYDDYGHHPTEIKATLQGARELYPDKNITLVFQPHMYSRTHELFDDFVQELGKADKVILAPIYAAREENTSGVSSEQLADAINKKRDVATYVESFDDIVTDIKQHTSAEGVVIIMGAGNITEIASELTK